MFRATDELVVVGDPDVVREIGGDTVAKQLGIRVARRPRTVGAHRYIRILSGVECTGVELSEFADFDLDRSTARAWSKFQARLADHVADMQDDDILLVEAELAADEDEADGSAPYVQFCAWGEEFVRCEVSSNDYLATEHLLDPAAVETLTALGWSAPTCGRDDDDPGEESANFYLDVDRSHVDRLAVMTVKALRDVFGVAHPVFLSAGNLTDDDEPAPDLGVPASQAISEPDPDELIAVSPRDREHLRALVDDARSSAVADWFSSGCWREFRRSRCLRRRWSG